MQYTYRPLKAGGVAPKLYGVGGHMHYVGVDEKITVQHTDDSETCLMQIPHWDFDWQRRYDYDAAIENLPVPAAGDKLIIAALTTTPWATWRSRLRSTSKG